MGHGNSIGEEQRGAVPGGIWPHVVGHKGASEVLCMQVAHDLGKTGHTRVVVKARQEPAMQAFVEGGLGLVPEEPLVGDFASQRTC